MATETRKPDDGGAAFPCAWCKNASYIKQGHIWLCHKHYRFSSMRSRAKRDGKIVPDRQFLESIVPHPFVCVGCASPMTWGREQGAGCQATLQHDRSGALRIICLACNTRHAQHPGDTYYDIPAGHKRCAKCDRVLPSHNFSRDASRPAGLKSSCRECSGLAHAKWRTENREYYNAKQREGRARRALAN